MKRTDLPPALRQLLEESLYATIATVCSDGHPWNTPVRGYFDENLNLYWASWTKNQHSRNIAHNPRIFVVVYDSHAPEGQAVGLYLEMAAQLVEDRHAVRKARRMYKTTFGETGVHEPFVGECPRRLYKAVPTKLWVNDESFIRGNFVDIRREFSLAGR